MRAGNVNIGNSRLLGQKSDFSDQPGKYFSLLPQNLSALRADEHLGQKKLVLGKLLTTCAYPMVSCQIGSGAQFSVSQLSIPKKWTVKPNCPGRLLCQQYVVIQWTGAQFTNNSSKKPFGFFGQLSLVKWEEGGYPLMVEKPSLGFS